MQLIVIDFLCGAGGVTSGFESAQVRGEKVAKVIAGLNHDAVAIDSHFSNFLHVEHFIEDVRKLDLELIKTLVAKYRALYPDAKIVLWFSLECTNFSKAKGGLPRDADSRTLADHVFRYFVLDPDYIMIENVVEFMSWGPLDEFGKPISKRSGSDYVKWCNKVQEHGFDFDWQEINSADFGAYTSRKRYFGIFAKHGLPIAWPIATHAKNPKKEGMFGKLEKWKAVREVLDLNDHGKSIFGRKKDLSEKTLARIYAGLVKYIAGGKDQFLVKYNSMKDERYAAPDINEPLAVITTRNTHYLVQPQFFVKYHGKWDDSASVENPLGTITTKEREAFVSAQFIDKQYRGIHNHQSVDQPAGTLMTFDKHRLVTAEKFIMNTNYSNVGSSLESPLPVITANRKHHYLINPQWFSTSASDIESPCCTIIARQDKAPLYLVTTEEGYVAIEVYKADSEYTQKIKEFMALYGIVDIKMRMLKVSELLKIQGFPDGYILKGTQADQKKFIGNSVVPVVVKKMAEALAERLVERNNKGVAA